MLTRIEDMTGFLVLCDAFSEYDGSMYQVSITDWEREFKHNVTLPSVFRGNDG